MRLCQKANCAREATHAIQIGCVNTLEPDDAPPSARVLMGVLVCEPCLDDETAEKWFEAAGDTLRPVFTIAMAGGPPPDFSRAVVLGVPLASAEYQHLMLESLKGRPN
jgi:hypothetical protein